MDGLVINGNTWPTSTPDDGPSTLYDSGQPSVADSQYIVIKTDGFLGGSEQDQLKDTKVDIIEYLGDNAYLCGYVQFESIISRFVCLGSLNDSRTSRDILETKDTNP